MCGTLALQRWNIALTFVCQWRSHSSSAMSSSCSYVRWWAALLTSTSTRPNVSTVCATSERQCSASARSPRTSSHAPACTLDPVSGDLCIVVLLEVRGHDICALARERDRNGAADAAVRAGNHRDLADQPVMPLVALLAMIRGRLHRRDPPRRILLLLLDRLAHHLSSPNHGARLHGLSPHPRHSSNTGPEVSDRLVEQTTDGRRRTAGGRDLLQPLTPPERASMSPADSSDTSPVTASGSPAFVAASLRSRGSPPARSRARTRPAAAAGRVPARPRDAARPRRRAPRRSRDAAR